MESPNTLHPTDQTLNDYGLGKLDDRSASTVNEHLEGCPDCRQRVAGLTSDTFLGRVRDGQKPAARSTPGGSLDGGTLSFMQAKPTSPPPATDTLPPGLADHPDYEIKRELGRGGMGVVYLAHNTLMGRDEVLKVMGRQIMERPGVLDRFLREIRAVARLRHPNIVTAYAAFRLEGGPRLRDGVRRGARPLQAGQGQGAAAGRPRLPTSPTRRPSGSSTPTRRGWSTATSSRAT